MTSFRRLKRAALVATLPIAVGIGFFAFSFNHSPPPPESPSAEEAAEVQELALIHSFSDGRTYPEVVEVERGVKVRLFNIADAQPHDPVVISRNEAGTEPVFADSFRVEPGNVTVVDFVPDEAGEFYITHRPHGHVIVGRLIVVDPS